MSSDAKKHWRRIEVLAIVLVLSFVPAIFITRVVPEAQNTITAPYVLAYGVAPVLGMWIILEVFQLVVVRARDTMPPLSKEVRAQWYFIAWVAFIFSFLFVLYAAVGNVEWIDYFYYKIPPLLRVWLIAGAGIGFLKLMPVIFYNRHRVS